MKLCGTRTILSLNAQVTFLQQQIAELLASKSPSSVFVDCSKLPYSRYLTLLFVFIQFSESLVTITTFILTAVLYHPILLRGPGGLTMHPPPPRRILWEWYKIVHWTSLIKTQDVDTRYRAMEPPFWTVFKMAAMQKCRSACSV